MELPNIHFQDFPIEFKEINPTDFPNFEVGEKIIIEPNDKGHIYESIKHHLDLDTKNTVVINAPVSYGKSYAIIMTIKDILIKYPNSLVIVASPFVSLVEQYVEYIHKVAGISESDIYDYSDLGRNPKVSYIDKRVQVVTVNTLLGNPGEDAFKNSNKKRDYLNNLIEICQNNNRKVFFIYDEIHDAIQNFKEEFVFNLWKWRNVIFKNFIISATYSEASKVVIGYLAELTDKKISIVEAKRIRFPEKQSKLYLHYSSSHNFTSNTDELVNVIDDLLKRNKEIDILCYSKTLSKSIIKDEIGKKLKERFGVLNDCTSELVSNQRPENEPPQNRYSEEKCNIGTNFKSGVSIVKKNHAFVIIMPPRATRLWFRNKYGIFSNGINSIIQAIARQRTKGEIHIILPRPDMFNINTLKKARMSEQQRNEFAKWYSQIRYYDNNLKPVAYYPLKIQNKALKLFYYLTLRNDVTSEIRLINEMDRDRFTRLNYPTFEIFKLEKGEEYLANTYKFFGEDISAYLTYCAFTNQFINCSLAGISYKTTLFFEDGKIQGNLKNYFIRYFGEDYYNIKLACSNFNMFYIELRTELFSQFDMKYKTVGKKKTTWNSIKPYTNKNFEIQLLRFCAILFYGKNYHYKEELEVKNTDIEYSRSNYFLDCISIAKNINLDEAQFSLEYSRKIKAYQNLAYFREELIKKVRLQTIGNMYYYIPVKPLDRFIEERDTERFNETIDWLLEYDVLIKNDIFNFSRNFANKTTEQKIDAFYKILIDDFIDTLVLDKYLKVTINGERKIVHPINSIKIIPNSDRIINLINPADFDEDYLEAQEKWAIENYGSLEEYNKTIDDALKAFLENK